MQFAFAKYHALGNDYIVIDPNDLPSPLTTEQVKIICHRNFGVGSDGILLGPLPASNAKCALKIYNPDGSEAEKSGNGLRIFSRYFWDRKIVGGEEFAIQTAGGLVRSTVFDGGKSVRVEMGRVSFWSDQIPVAGPRREVLNEKISVGGREFSVLRRDDRQSALRRGRARHSVRAGHSAAIRPAAGDARKFSEPHERPVPESARPCEHPD